MKRKIPFFDKMLKINQIHSKALLNGLEFINLIALTLGHNQQAWH